MPAVESVRLSKKARAKSKSNAAHDAAELIPKAKGKAKVKARSKGKAKPGPKAAEARAKERAKAKANAHSNEDIASKLVKKEEQAVAEIKCVSPRIDFLLPAHTKNLLCNWAGAGDGHLFSILRALKKLWGSSARDAVIQPRTFYDLGCGDGRVVHVVCKAFPSCIGKGIDLNAQLVDEATRRAKRLGIAGRCTFQAGNIMGRRLNDADAVFLYFPIGAMGEIVRRAIMPSSMQAGTSIFSAEEPLWQPVGSIFYPSPTHGVISLREGTDALYHYTWHGTKNPIGAGTSQVQKTPTKS